MVHPIWKDFPEVQTALVAVKRVMQEELTGLPVALKHPLLAAIDAPGKYWRSGLLLLLAIEREGEVSAARISLAAALELFHLATLVHDDVIDGADSRRGLPTLHVQQSNRLAIYAGDYLLAYAGRLAVQGLSQLGLEQSPTGLQTRLLEKVLAGEIRQLLNQHNPQMTLKDYLKQIQGKTALLFALACQGGTLARHSRAGELVLAYQAGRALGMAFQLADDLLDYEEAASETGKPQFQDIQNGIYTAPILFAKASNPALADWLMTKATGTWTLDELQFLQSALKESGGLEKTRQLKQAYLLKAMSAFARLGLSEQTCDLILKKI